MDTENEVHKKQEDEGGFESVFSRVVLEARLAFGSYGEQIEKLRKVDIGLHLQRKDTTGSHSSVRYPPDNALEVNSEETSYASLLERVPEKARVDLYVHIPFCEQQCTFCRYIFSPGHHASQELIQIERNKLPYNQPLARGKAAEIDPRDQHVKVVLDALLAEMRTIAKKLEGKGLTIKTIYIGGGTPLFLTQELLGKIVSELKHNFDIEPSAAFCVEGSPKTVLHDNAEAKIRSLVDAGVNRFSVGVQSGHDEALRYTARGYTGEDASAAHSKLKRVAPGININLDFIQGLRGGHAEELETTLRWIYGSRPRSITYYHGRFGVDTPQGKQIESLPGEFAEEGEILLGRLQIFKFLAKLGYKQVDGNRFILESQYQDPNKATRTVGGTSQEPKVLIGVGPHYGHILDSEHPENNVMWRTLYADSASGATSRESGEAAVGRYVDMVERGQVIPERVVHLDREELLAGSYVTGLRTKRRPEEHLGLENELPHEAVYYRTVFNKLVDLGLVQTLSTGEQELTELGRLYEDEVLWCFCSPKVGTRMSKFGFEFPPFVRQLQKELSE